MKGNKKSDEYKSVFGQRNKSSSSNHGSADWGTADPGTISRLISVVTSRGGALRFGYTRDGGAYALGLYYGSESQTEYCRPADDLTQFLEDWIEFYENLPMTNGRSPEQ